MTAPSPWSTDGPGEAAPHAAPPDATVPDAPSPLTPGRRELLGLLLVLAALAFAVYGAATAYSFAETSNGFTQISEDDFGGFGDLQDEPSVDWGTFFEAFSATVANYIMVPLLVGGVALALARRWDRSSWTAKLALSVLFPLGLVVFVAGLYATSKILTADDEQFGFSMIGSESTGFLDKLGSVSPVLVATLCGLVAAWFAFTALPFSNRGVGGASPSVPGPQPFAGTGGAVPPAAPASYGAGAPAPPVAPPAGDASAWGPPTAPAPAPDAANGPSYPSSPPQAPPQH